MLLRLIPYTAYIVISLVSRTLRTEYAGLNAVVKGKKSGKNYIFAFWHSRFFVMPYYYRKKIGDYPVSILTSKSMDGEYVSRLMRKFGFNTVRGSTLKGGDNALRILARELENGRDVAVTPDGPRGPRCVVQPGIIMLASITGCPIVPVGYDSICKKRLKTWDRFVIPCPFSKTVLTALSPVYVPKGLSDNRIEQIRQEVEKKLLSICPE